MIPLDLEVLPDDHREAVLVGRVWDPAVAGPSVVVVRNGDLLDLSASFATMRDVIEHPDPADAIASATGPVLGSVGEAVSAADRGDPAQVSLLAPCDLQVVKAAGVTFAVSMIERVIEERAHGDRARADEIRGRFAEILGGSLERLVPGSREAERLREHLLAEGWWSQYLEVGIGPDAEVFTKAPVLAAVGCGAPIGVLRSSRWNNPEPEMVLAVASTARPVGAVLGNDVNLRDVEGRSALLLSKAKDNTASAAIGPFIRLFDERYRFDRLTESDVTLRIAGEDGFSLTASSPLSGISRSPTELIAQTIGAHHGYPDGFMLYLGTLFAPTQDRSEPGGGFSHRSGDVVTISEPRLGRLVNRVRFAEDLPPWSFGIADLMNNLARREMIR